MNWQVVATLIAALSFVVTGFGLSWKFGGAFAELRMRDDELRSGLADVKLTAASLATSSAAIPEILRRIGLLEDVAAQHQKTFVGCPMHLENQRRMSIRVGRIEDEIRTMAEKVGHVRGRLDSQHDVEEEES